MSARVLVPAAMVTIMAVLGAGVRGRVAPVRRLAGVHPPRPVRIRRPGGRRREPDDSAVAQWCEQVAAALRSGSSLTNAVVETDPTGSGPPVVPSVAHAVRRGRSLADALGELPADPSTAPGLAAAVLTTCAQLGGPSAAAVERVAATLHARADERAERRAASAQARLSARVLTTLPFAVLAFMAVTEPSVRAALATPGGAACLLLGGGLNLTGWWWMRRIIGART